MRRSPTQRRGDIGEARALAHLRGAGLSLEARNWQCRYGEIDLVMRDGDELVFVEVRRRQRRDTRFASAAESVGPRKQARLRRTAECYLAGRRTLPACRFDVVALDADGAGAEHLRWIRDAFRVD
jgi:putative endonuclease